MATTRTGDSAGSAGDGVFDRIGFVAVAATDVPLVAFGAGFVDAAEAVAGVPFVGFGADFIVDAATDVPLVAFGAGFVEGDETIDDVPFVLGVVFDVSDDPFVPLAIPVPAALAVRDGSTFTDGALPPLAVRDVSAL